LADRFHVIFFEVRFRNLGRIVGGEDLDLDDEMVLPGPKLLPAVVTRYVRHVATASQNVCIPVMDCRARQKPLPIHPSHVSALLSS
jgi:hypothetical protein